MHSIPPYRYNSHMQSTPPQQIQKPSSKFRRKEGSDLANISHSKINYIQNKLQHQRIITISYLQPENRSK
jgi:hypothetical protein